MSYKSINIKSPLNGLKEIYEYRYIIYSLVKKDIFGQYRNSFFGFSWHFISPILMLLLYYVVFTEIRTKSIEDFWIFLSSAIFPFHFLTSNLVGGTNCIISNSALVKKIYFPREILIISRALSKAVVLVIGQIVVLITLVLFGNGLAYVAIFLPIVIMLTFLFAIGYMLFFSAITVYVRDVQHFLSAVYLIIFISTPVFYVASMTAGLLGSLIWFNPFTYFVIVYQDLLYWQVFPSYYHLSCCFLLTLVSLVIGIYVFRRLKNGFTERL